MTRAEFRKMAHELRVALGNNYMEQLEEMVAAYEGLRDRCADLELELTLCRRKKVARRTDKYCKRCGESPESASHTFDHDWEGE